MTAAWEHAEGNGGGSRFLDVPPITGKPTVRWTAQVTPQYFPWEWTGMARPRALLLASPLGIVTTYVSNGRSRYIVLDASTGERRIESDGTSSEQPLAIAGDVLILGASRGVIGRDLRSGVERWRATDSYSSLASHADGLLAVAMAGRVDGFAMPDPSRTPEQIWSIDARALGASEILAVRVLSRSLIAIMTDRYHQCVLLDGETGHVLPFGSTVVDPTDQHEWFMPGKLWLGDVDGFVGWQREHGTGCALYTADRTRRFALPDDSVLPMPLALTPRLILNLVRQPDKSPKVQCIDRRSGVIRASFPLGTNQESIVAVQDGIYAWLVGERPAHAVSFIHYDGKLEWRSTLVKGEDEIVAIAPLPHRLYVLTDQGSVFCIEAR